MYSIDCHVTINVPFLQLGGGADTKQGGRTDRRWYGGEFVRTVSDHLGRFFSAVHQAGTMSNLCLRGLAHHVYTVRRREYCRS